MPIDDKSWKNFQKGFNKSFPLIKEKSQEDLDKEKEEEERKRKEEALKKLLKEYK